ncbi:hypothetical protein K4K60_010513 [Colletotrichum sp. SAR11_57]|nr:hypothetical protein K4K60_010513 [Colletotrichum sp. SAR11_57]
MSGEGYVRPYIRDRVVITAQCLCKAHTFKAQTYRSNLPLKASCCHCNSCRHVSGALYTACVKWPSPSEHLADLKKYSYSDSIDLYSCGTCSAQMFCLGPAVGDVPWVVTGALENAEDLVQYASHMHVGDTIDGGASVWLPRYADGAPVKRWREGAGKSEELPLDWPGAKALSSETLKAGPTPDITPFSCHCGGIDLKLKSGADLGDFPEEDLDTWFVDKETLKYRGSLECCDSCRLSFGADLMAWTFAPLSHIDFGGDNPPDAAKFPRNVSYLRDAVTAKDKDPRLGTLAMYESSRDVQRYFCSKCSASVFYAVNDRPGMVDIAVGLLQHPDGARAEGLLKWLDKVGWAQDVAGGWREGLANTSKRLLNEWTEKTQGPAHSSH